MAIFNSYVKLPEGNMYIYILHTLIRDIQCLFKKICSVKDIPHPCCWGDPHIALLRRCLHLSCCDKCAAVANIYGSRGRSAGAGGWSSSVRNSSDESMLVATLPWNHGVFMARVGKKDDYSPLNNMVYHVLPIRIWRYKSLSGYNW